MQQNPSKRGTESSGQCCSCGGQGHGFGSGMTRRSFLGNVGGATVLGGATLMLTTPAGATFAEPIESTSLPVGKPVRVQPVLAYDCPQPQEKTSWRGYGGIQTDEAAQQEATRIEADLTQLAAGAEFPIKVLPMSLVVTKEQVAQTLAVECDVRLVYGAGGSQVYELAADKTPLIVFVRHRTEPHYLWYEITHWRLLRGNGDEMVQPALDVGDVVVDDQHEILWRLRACTASRTLREPRCWRSAVWRPTASRGSSTDPNTRRTCGATRSKR